MDFYFKKANDYYNKKDYKKALSLYKKSIENQVGEACSLYNAAVCHIKLKEYNEAIDLLKQALEIKLDHKYLFNLAYCYSLLGDNAKALTYFNWSWAINNDDYECKKAISMILDSFNKTKK
ncbi:tetratricopeptide repeat protein [Candidatus Arthromitus sp. SFB-rat-Yit]|uniref:tetratricopeptide repeat protein n=1 Tax=Candidatus Arthromitus sp. SFB-rat-Yit TaxID=1041504 RepID=UPI000227A323|nr:tetratricopeptide repeat protein [Candidatus Arthromitus sp. SFB-rat-Yit]BAK81469.1 tetratricopeptide repeat protein [Candidatus Arthromitus sp. SFB-rat-Yit]